MDDTFMAFSSVIQSNPADNGYNEMMRAVFATEKATTPVRFEPGYLA